MKTVVLGSRVAGALFLALCTAAASAGDPSGPLGKGAASQQGGQSKAVVEYGIESRTPWTSSRVVGSPEPPPPYRVIKTFTKLTIKQPLVVKPQPGTDLLLVVQHLGVWAGPAKIVRIKNDPETTEMEELVSLDRIVYGFAFHPKFAENGYLYVGGNGPLTSTNKKTIVSRFTMDTAPPYKIDPKSEQEVISWESDGHNGGDLGFSPLDGMLYVTAGDGTSDSDKNRTGQDMASLCGKMLRIDVDHVEEGQTYSVPKDNPFVDLEGARPEIWALGLRNPWRMTFDEQNGQLWVGNNGQDLWEQVFLIERAGNYGWSIYEGSHPFNLERKRGPTPILKPAAEHPHSEARSLSGGVVYHGEKLPELRGAYIYGDWSTGKIWGLRHDGQKPLWHQELTDTSLQIGGFGSDAEGELFVIDQGGGLYRLEPTPPQDSRAKFPRRLSETGLFASTAEHQADPGLVPYSVNAPQWVDGAEQERYIGLPGSAQIEFPASRGWTLAEGAVLIKTLSLELKAGNPASRRRIETQMLTRQQGEWQAYCYAWTEDQRDARLVKAAGGQRLITIQDPSQPGGTRQQMWNFSSRAGCMGCHSRAANYVLGLNEMQMNTVHDYGQVLAPQLRTLERLGLFHVNALEHEQELYTRLVKRLQSPLVTAAGRFGHDWGPKPPGAPAPKAGKWNFPDDVVVLLPAQLELARRELQRVRGKIREQLSAKPMFTTLLPKPLAEYRRLVDPYAVSGTLDARARSYLHANCAHCHVEAGGGNALMELEFNTEAPKTNLFDVRPQHAVFGIAGARLVAPGDPYRSVLYYRMASVGGSRMPRLGSNVVDESGLRLMHDWIAGLPHVSDDADRDRAARVRAKQKAAVDKLCSLAPTETVDGAQVDELLSATSGALLLVAAIDNGALPADVRKQIVAKAAQHGDPSIRDLFERFVPLADRARRLGTSIDPGQLLAVAGDAARGAELYAQVARVQCKTCHRVGPGEDTLGPELTHIGKKYNRAQLLESILEPSKTIDQKYTPYLLETTEGRVLQGLLVKRTDEEVVLRDAQNKELRVPSGDVEQLTALNKSIMPEFLLRDLTAREQAADLLAYLESLK